MRPIPSESSSSLSPDAAPPLERVTTAPVFAADEISRRLQAEETAREEAWSAVYHWRGERLLPWSLGRERAWLGLCRADVPLESEAAWNLSVSASQVIKLLFVCFTSADVLERAPVETLVERADRWADQRVPRAETDAAAALAWKIRADVLRVRARIRPSDRRGAPGAVPVVEASYLEMLCAATAGAESLRALEWDVPLVRGWSLIHSHWVSSGLACRWLDVESSETGAWLAAFRRRQERGVI